MCVEMCMYAFLKNQFYFGLCECMCVCLCKSKCTSVWVFTDARKGVGFTGTGVLDYCECYKLNSNPL